MELTAIMTSTSKDAQNDLPSTIPEAEAIYKAICEWDTHFQLRHQRLPYSREFIVCI